MLPVVHKVKKAGISCKLITTPHQYPLKFGFGPNYLETPSDGRMMIITRRKVKVLIILDRFSAVRVQNPMLRSEMVTREGSVTAATQMINVGSVSWNIASVSYMRINEKI